MITSNYRKILASILTTDKTYPKGLLPIVDTQNDICYVSGDFYNGFPGTQRESIRYFDGQYMQEGSISIGSGDKIESESDYELESPILTGFSWHVTKLKGQIDGTNVYVAYTLTIENTGTNTITVREVGYFSSVKITTTQYDSNANQISYFMLDRAVLANPVSIGVGETKQIYYRISSLIQAGSGGGGSLSIIPKSITANGTFDPQDDSADGYSMVTVNVPNSYAAGDEGKVVSSGALVAQTARSTEINANGTYDTTLNNSVTVNVSGGGSATLITKTVTANGTYNASADSADGYSSVEVDVRPNLQTKTVTQNGDVTPDSGYDGLSKVTVNVSGGGGVYSALGSYQYENFNWQTSAEVN